MSRQPLDTYELNNLGYILVEEQGSPAAPSGEPLDPAVEIRRALEQTANPADLQEVLWFIDSAPEYSHYLVGSNIAASPEIYDQETTEPLDARDSESSIAERAELSRIGAEGWRTAATVNCIPVLASTDIQAGQPAGVRWFRSYVPQPGQPEVTRTAGDFREAAGEHLKSGQLADEQFIHWGSRVQEAIRDNHGYLALAGIGLLHDVAKSDRFTAAAAAGGIPVEGKDHDAVLHSVIANEAVRDELLPTLAFIKQISPPLNEKGAEHKASAYSTIVKVFSVNADATQLLQGEAPAHFIEELVGLDPHIRALYFQYKKLDIAGVRGQVQHAGSTIIDAETYQDFEDLEAVIASPDFDSATERYNAYLTRRAARLGLDIESLPLAERPAALAQARLAVQQRMHDRESFNALVADFNAEPEIVRDILIDQLNRTGETDTAILHGYAPITLMALKRHPEFSQSYLKIYALLLHEAAILETTRSRQGAHVGTADLYTLVQTINDNSIKAGATFRFRVEESERGKAMLIPELADTERLDNINDLPEFNGEVLRDKRALLIGMAGGNDILHAKALSEVLASKYGLSAAVYLSIRKGERAVRDEAGITEAGTKVIGPRTRPRGDWRTFPEGKLASKPNNPEVHLLNSTNQDMVSRGIAALIVRSGAEVVIGVDPSGDSLTPASKLESLAPHLAARQDHTVIRSLARLSLPGFTAVIGPGATSRYAKDTLLKANASRLPLDEDDHHLMIHTYIASGLLHGEYDAQSTTAMLYQLAHAGKRGIQALDVPNFRANSETNPYRVFHEVREANAQIAILDAQAHDAAIRE